MRVQGKQPTLMHADTHAKYLPWPENPRMAEARRVAETINETKVTDPATGAKIYDSLVDSLVANTLAIAKQYEHVPEPAEWSSAQRVVWRYSHLPYERRHAIVTDRSVDPFVKAFAVVNAGRWLVPCPFPGCNGAQYASFADRRFHCVDCNSKAVDGRWVEIIWPQDHLAVEQWLQSRPLENQHWNPGETNEDIAMQDTAANAGIHLPPSVGKRTLSNVDPNKWPKTTTLLDGTVVPVLHYGTPEWDESQKVNQ